MAEEHIQGHEAIGPDGPGEIQNEGYQQGRQDNAYGSQPFATPGSGKGRVGCHRAFGKNAALEILSLNSSHRVGLMYTI